MLLRPVWVQRGGGSLSKKIGLLRLHSLVLVVLEPLRLVLVMGNAVLLFLLCRTIKHFLCQLLKILLNQGFVHETGHAQGRKNRVPVTDEPGDCYAAVCGNTSSLAAGTRLAARDAEALASLPKAFAADTKLAGQLGFGHVVLMLKDKMLEVILQ